MVKQTVTKEIYVTDDAREFTSEALAKQHESKLSWFSDRVKSLQVDTFRIDKEYHTVFIEGADSITRKTIGDVFSLTNPENLVDGWNLILDSKKQSGCFPIERLITEAFQSKEVRWNLSEQEQMGIAQFKKSVAEIIARNTKMQASPEGILGNLIMEF